MIKVIIADDHPIFREGLKKVIAKSHDISVADEASSGDELLAKVKKNHFDVIILDISMPGISGLEILRDLQGVKGGRAILMLSAHPEEQYALRALKGGASGYLTKGSPPDEIIKAIRKVFLGGRYVSATLAEKLASELVSSTEKPLHEKLSDREYQVMLQMTSGKSIKEIAGELCLSVPTISTYRARILQKLNLKNNVELIHYAIKNNLV